MWFLYIILWLILSFLLAYLFSNMLYSHYIKNVQLSGKRNADLTKDDDTRIIKGIRIKVRNLGITKVTISEVGIYNKEENNFFAFKTVNHVLPLTLSQKEQIILEKNYEEIPIDFDDVSRSNIKIYYKDIADNYYFESL